MACPSSCKENNCSLTYREHLLSINISADALPTRGRAVSSVQAREKVLSKDLDAYKRMRRQGVQPAVLRGAASLESMAERKEHVEAGASLRVNDPKTGQKRWVKDSALTAFGDTFGRSPLTPATEPTK